MTLEAKLTVGARIYYTGDMANQPAIGTITETRRDRWGFSVDIGWDAEEGLERKPPTRGLQAAHFSPGPGQRFYLLDEWRTLRAGRIGEMQAARRGRA